MSDIVRYGTASTGVDRVTRRSARAAERNKAVSQFRQARIADEAEVVQEKIFQTTHLLKDTAMAVTAVAGVIKQLEEQTGGDMALAARLQRLGDRHEWICGDILDDFRHDIRRK